MKHDHSNYYPASGSRAGLPGAQSDARGGKPGKGGQDQAGQAKDAIGGKQEFRIAPELLGLFCVLVSALLFISLASYHPADPNFNHVVSGAAQIKNWAGMFGAYLGAFFIDFIGFAAYIPCLFLAVLGLRLCLRSKAWVWWRWCGFILLAACAAVAASAWNMGLGDVRSGGLFGHMLLELSLRFFNPLGSGVVWSGLFLLMLQMILGFSWRQLALNFAAYMRSVFEDGNEHPAQFAPAGTFLQEPVVEAVSLVEQESATEQKTVPVSSRLVEAEQHFAQEYPPESERSNEQGGYSDQPLETETGSQTNILPHVVIFKDNNGNSAHNGIGEAKDNQARNSTSEALDRLVALAAERQARQQELDSHNALFRNGGPESFEHSPTINTGTSTTSMPSAGSAFSLGKIFRGFFSGSGEANNQTVADKRGLPHSGTVYAQPASVASREPAKAFSQASSGTAAAERGLLLGNHPNESGNQKAGNEGEQPLWLADLEAGRIGASALQGRENLSRPVQPVQYADPIVQPIKTGPQAFSGPTVHNPQTIVPEPQAPLEPTPLEPQALHPARPQRIPVKLPPLDLLHPVGDASSAISRDELEAKGRVLMTCLKDFSIQAELVHISPGPVVTSFEIRPAPGVKSSRISGISDDLALNLKAVAVRIQAPIPGTDTVGVEIPNEKREVVGLRELLASPVFRDAEPVLSMALGKDIAGMPTVADLARMPHMLVAGATGTGKSVFLNAVLLSFLYKARPEELKLLLIDPKRIEMAIYADLPHLVHPIVTEMSLAKNALDWAVSEMERRYGDIARLGVRNVLSYNQKLKEMGSNRPANLSDLAPMPYLVIVIDELADLMLTAGKEVETSIVRLAQLARAAGIHLIIATQRPSVDVVTGLIKANFPCRISFQVTSKHDSRTILDMVGAEYLLGRGDMLFKPSGGRLQRLHGAFVPDDDVGAVADYWRAQQAPDYQVDFTDWGQDAADADNGSGSGTGGAGSDDVSRDPVYIEAVDFVREQGKASISLIQRRFRIGFNRAARYIEQMEQDGIIGPADGSKPRVVR